MAGLRVGQAYEVFHRPGFGLLIPDSRSLSTQPPFATCHNGRLLLFSNAHAQMPLICTNKNQMGDKMTTMALNIR